MIEQRTEEWYDARIGKFTASGFSKLLTRPADGISKFSKTAMNYIEKAAAQLYYQDYYHRPDSESTRWGMDKEEEAIRKFSERLAVKTADIGFILHPRLKEVGATPDAKVIDPRESDKFLLAQIKCPFNSKNHISYLKRIHDNQSLKRVKKEYYWQMMGEMWVTGAELNYFVIYDPTLDEARRLHIVKIYPDLDDFRILEEKLEMSLLERDRILDEFKTGKKAPKPLSLYW